MDVIIDRCIEKGQFKEEVVDREEFGKRTVNSLTRFYVEMLARVIAIEIPKKNKITKDKLKKKILKKIRSESKQVCLP